MGLDSYIFAEVTPEKTEHIYNKLVGEKPEKMEVLYWRKQHQIIEWFGEILDVGIQNCEDYEISEVELTQLLEALESGELEYADWCRENTQEDIDKLKAILKTTDFSKTKFIFTNWW